MTRRILMAESVLTAAILAGAMAEQARIRRQGAYVVIDRGQPDVPSPSAMPKVGRNEPCPCGSGAKFKKCCLNATSHPIPTARKDPS